MKEPLLKGHPLHAILTDLPIGMHILGTASDYIGLITRKPAFRTTARHAHTGAFISGIAAGAVGLWDYQGVPMDTPTRKTGALHGYLNGSVLALLTGSLIFRRESMNRPDGRPHPVAVGLATTGLLALAASGWLGGDLVYRLGWRVTPAEWDEQIESELQKRGETDVISRAHDTVEQYEQTSSLIP